MQLNRELILRIWNIIVTACTSILAIYLPLKIVFSHEFNHIPALYWFVNIVFILDIFVSIAKHRIFDDDEIMQKEYSVKAYLKTWFVVDLIAAIPFGLMGATPVIALIRLIKMSKVAMYMNDIRHGIIAQSGLLTLLFFGYWVLHSLHWLSCTWLSIIGIDLAHSITENYIDSLYFITTTLTTVGYGDITPVNATQKIFTIFLELTGVGFYGFIIGNIASILTKKDPARLEYLENIDHLSILTRYRNLPLELQRKVKDYYTYKWKNKHGYEESEFLSELPPTLKRSVAIHLKKDFLDQIPLFKDSGDEFLESIALSLRPVIVTPGDYLFEAGEVGKAMYFVIKGKLSVLSGDHTRTISTMRDGDFFGEIALFRQEPRTASVRAETYCDLYALNNKAFKRVIAKYPDIGKKMEEVAQKRFEN